MKCLYCGGPLPLALLKKITGAGEFCSEACRSGYQSEFNRLAVGRLQQARVSRRVLPVAGELNLPAADVAPSGVVPAEGEYQTHYQTASARAAELESRANTFVAPAETPVREKPVMEEPVTEEPVIVEQPDLSAPPPVWAQQSWAQQSIALPEPVGASAPAAVAEAPGEVWREVPEPMFLTLVPETKPPSWDSRTEGGLAPPPSEPQVESLFAALQTAMEETAAPLSVTEPAPGLNRDLSLDDMADVPPPAAKAPEEDLEAEVRWMSPRGPMAMTISAAAMAAGLRTPQLVPAPIFVYLQLPESLIAGSVGKPALWWAGAASMSLPMGLTGRKVGSADLEVPLAAMREVMPFGGAQVAGRSAMCGVPAKLAPVAGLAFEAADLRFSGGGTPQPALLPNSFFSAPKPAWAEAVRVQLRVHDTRFARFVNDGEREETRERIQKIMSQKAAQRAMMAEGPTVTLPVEAIQPALDLLASVSSTILARQQQGEQFPALPAVATTQEALPRIAAHLAEAGSGTGTSLPAGEPGAPWTSQPAAHLAQPAAHLAGGGEGLPREGAPARPVAAAGWSTVPETPAAVMPVVSPAEGAFPTAVSPLAALPAPVVPSPAPTPAPAWTPAPEPDGRPAGWPADLPYPPPQAAGALTAPAQPAPAQPAPVAPETPVNGGAALPGMPPIQGNVYMFGNEINAKNEDEDESKALVKPEPTEAEKTEAETKPNFTRPQNGIPLSGGGTMNVGTMVVVNQPSGTVNINAASPTAQTFESRLRQKGPAPLSSIAEAVGVQMPVPLSPKEMPLRMNFQGRLDTASPVKWPGMNPAPIRRKMFLGTKPRPEGGAGGGKPSIQAGRPPGLMSGPPRSPLGGPALSAPPLPQGADAGETGAEEKGAMGWIKSISTRFGKK
jgi:hypothetical protein